MSTEDMQNPAAYDQQDFLNTVRNLATIQAQQATEAGLVGVTPDTVLSELTANLLTCALVADQDLMVAITMKAEAQAARIMQRRAEAIQAEMDIVAKLNGTGWGNA